MRVNQSENINKIIWIGLILLVIIGGALRTVNLQAPSFWVDELNHFYAGKSIIEGEKPQLPSGVPYTRAPLYNYSVALSMRIFGEGEFAARFPSALFGSLSILLIFLIGQKFFNSYIGILAAFFVAFSPFEIGWSRISKMYTLFQFLFLFGFFTFYLGFESSKSRSNQSLMNNTNIFNWGIKWGWLLISGISFVISLTVQNLTALVTLSLFCYLSLMALVIFYRKGLQAAFRSKYILFLIVGCALGILLVILFPGIKSKIEFLHKFNPLWAQRGGGGKLLYFEFLTSRHIFPLGALFLIGAVQILIRLRQVGYYTLINFVVPILLLSFLVKTRVDRYILNLFPLFCLIAAYGLFNIIEFELALLRLRFSENNELSKFFSWSMLKKVVIILMLCWIPVARWFYDSLKIPLVKSGRQFIGEYYTNGAVTHREWREACNYVKKNYDPHDLIITTHALSVRYYLGKVDFTIFGGDLGNFREIASNGTHKLEPYANAAVLENQIDLQRILASSSRGWVIADNSRFAKMVPRDISDFIRNHLSKEEVDTNNTITIYSWNEEIQKSIAENQL